MSLTRLMVVLYPLNSTYKLKSFRNKNLTISLGAEDLQASVSNKKTNLAVYVQLITMSVSNIISWLPADMAYLTAIFLPKYSVKGLHWIMVLITPINSILYPIIFIAILIRKEWKDKQSEKLKPKLR